MLSISNLLRQHIDYTIWASTRLLHSAHDLSDEEREADFGTADKSVRGTMTHLLRSERTWLRRLQEGTPSVPSAQPEDQQWTFLTEAWPAIQNEWQNWIGNLTDSEAERVLNYSDLKGNPRNNSVADIVLHVVNHSTHHRGQISGFLRALGKTPPSLDLIAFIRERQSQ